MKIFNEQHEMFRQTVRSFVDKEIAPHIEEWEAAGRMPRWIWPRMGELGLLGVEYDDKYGGGRRRRADLGRAARGVRALALRLLRHGRRACTATWPRPTCTGRAARR